MGSDPNFEEMKKILCVQQTRPVICNRWTEDMVMLLLCYNVTVRSIASIMALIPDARPLYQQLLRHLYIILLFQLLHPDLYVVILFQLLHPC